MAEKSDAATIGAGPNGLTTFAYLSKAGQRVLLLEKRFEAAGKPATEEVTEGEGNWYRLAEWFLPPSLAGQQ